MKITRLEIEGFRSLRKVIWEPGDLNVVIGPNGSGKSNLLRLLELIAISAQGRLGKYIQSMGGMEPIVWDGIATSIKLLLDISPGSEEIDSEQYALELVRLGAGGFYRIDNECLESFPAAHLNHQPEFALLRRQGGSAAIKYENDWIELDKEYVPDEESLLSIAGVPFLGSRLIPSFQQQLAAISVYHDLHVNKDAAIRQPSIARLEKRVEPDGQNLISVLHTLYTGDRDFKRDVNTAMQAAFGDDFEELVFPPAADQKIQLRIRWKSLRREQSAADLSDGTLRFLFLLTVLASPSPAPIIAIDEPETGLHPAMLPIIAEYAADAAMRSQVILTTHSPQLLNAFSQTRPTTTIAKWENGETTLQTLSGDSLDYWLKEYSLGGLFESGELEQMG